MKKKNILTIVCVILLVVSAVTAVIVFRRQIADLFASVKSKLTKPSADPKPDFTQEEIEVFADI